VFIWNLESRQNPFSRSILSVLPDYDQGTPQYYKMWWRKCFETEAYKAFFGDEGKTESTFEWNTPVTDERVSTCIVTLVRIRNVAQEPVSTVPPLRATLTRCSTWKECSASHL
jgi:hypothetical protein